MRTLKDGVAMRLQNGASTFCRCWLIERKDGTALGFTDHDAALTFGEHDYEPESGFTRSALQTGLGLSVDNMEAIGALRSDAVTEEDVARGRYDGAKITQWLVDWQNPARREIVFVGEIGEIRRGSQAFEVEFVGISERLNRPMGRAYLRACDAELGDARCGAVLSAVPGSVAKVLDERRLLVSGFEDAQAHPTGRYSLGRLTWRTGANAGETAAVRLFSRRSGGAELDLWTPPAAPVAQGDDFDLLPGCDKTAATCRTVFDNFERFRGFPHMPGEDWASSYPTSEENHDGGSLFE